MWTVIVNNIDYTKDIESVDFNSGIGEGSAVTIYTIPTSESNRTEVPIWSSYSPVEIKRDGVTIFKGHVGAPEFTRTGTSATATFARYDCYDEGAGFKTVLVDGEYTGSIESVANQIMSQYAPNYNLIIQEGTNINVAFAFTYQPLNAVLDQLASAISGYWFVHPNGNIYIFQETTTGLENTYTTIEYSNVETTDGYKHSMATEDIRNKVIVLGGEGRSNYNEVWNYDGSSDVYELKYPPQNITVTWNGEPVYLIPEGYSGDPYKDSDQDFKNTFDTNSGNSTSNSAYTHVVIHHIAAKTATKSDLYQWHVTERGWSDIGYHWYIKKDGTVISCRPESKVGAHARGHNSYTIGIACEGDYERFDTSMPTAQFNALVTKTLDVMNRYNMPKTNVMYHGEVSNTECPGKYFPTDDVRNAVQKGSASNISYTGNSSAAGADSRKRLYISYADQRISTVPDYKPVIGTKIEISYTSGYFVAEEIVDRASVTEYGRIIPEVIADTSITSKEDARAIAKAILKQRKNIKETVSFGLVHYKNLFAGQKVYLSWLGRYGRVSNVQSRFSSYSTIRLEVELI